MASSSSEHHVDRVGHRLGHRFGCSFLASGFEVTLAWLITACSADFHAPLAPSVNAGELLQRLAGAKVQQGCKQKGPRYRGPFCLSRFFLGGGAWWWQVRDGRLDLCLA